MIIPQQFIQKINRIVTHEPLILLVDESGPRLPRKSTQNVIVLLIQFDVVPVQILEQLVRAEHLCDFDKLVRVAVAVEEGFFPEDHGCEHGA